MSADSYWYFRTGKHGVAGRFAKLTKEQAAEDAGRCQLARGQPLRPVEKGRTTEKPEKPEKPESRIAKARRARRERAAQNPDPSAAVEEKAPAD